MAAAMMLGAFGTMFSGPADASAPVANATAAAQRTERNGTTYTNMRSCDDEVYAYVMQRVRECRERSLTLGNSTFSDKLLTYDFALHACHGGAGRFWVCGCRRRWARLCNACMQPRPQGKTPRRDRAARLLDQAERPLAAHV